MTKITTQLIIELAGFPREHVEDTMQKMVENIKKQFAVEDARIHDVQRVKELWSTFVDIKIKFDDLGHLTLFCFDYMPSSVDILEPVKFNLESQELNALFNDLMGKIHHYDMLLKNYKITTEMLKKKLKPEQ